MKYLKVLFVVLAVMVFVLTACTPQAEAPAAEETAPEAEEAPVEEPVAEEPQTLVIAMNMDDLITLDPAIAGESTNQFIHANVYDTLIVFEPDAFDVPIGNLAESWEASPDATEYTFHLKEGITFSTGNPLTANDVVFSWLRGKYMQHWMFGILDTVEAVDDYTVKVVLASPAADFYALASHPGWGITDSKTVMEHGGLADETAFEQDTAKEWMDQNSVGTAAYVLTSWEPKAEVTFEINPNYRGEKPYFDRVILKHVEDPTAMLQMLQTGDADIVPSVDIDLADVAQADANLQVMVNQSLDTNYLAMTGSCTTLESPETAELLCQKEVRTAVYYAIDFDGLIDSILKGYAVHAPALLPIGMSEIDPSLAPGRDVEKAKQLLTDAGYPDGITIDLTYNSSPQRDTIAAKLQSDLAEAGITVNLKPMEATVYLTKMRAQELPIGFGGWTPDYMDPSIWTDNYVCPEAGIAFRMQYDNPDTCALGQAIKAEVDPVKRAELIADLEMVWLDEMNFFNLYQPQYITAMDKDLKGYVYHPARMVDLTKLSK